ncbi:MAG: NUDIX hydrolase [bacterium]|nr:NUDIX hydrolase [bacterium]
MPKRLSSAAIILEAADGRALFVKANYKTYWTFPGGVVDPGETPKQAAVREVREEVNVGVDIAAVDFVAVADRRSAVASTYQFIFQAKLPADAENTVRLQASEIDEYDFVTKQQVLDGDREYSKAALHWATGQAGYIEQAFDEF